MVRHRRDEIDLKKVRADLKAARVRSDSEIEAEAVEDGDAWTDRQIAQARGVCPALRPDTLRAVRTRLGLTQTQFAARFGFTAEAIRHYETGEETPTGTAATLLRVIAAEPDAVARALGVSADA